MNDCGTGQHQVAPLSAARERRSGHRAWRAGSALMVLALAVPPVMGQVIFIDGFETGNTSAWSGPDPSGDPCTATIYATSFTGDEESWPAPWSVAGGVQRQELVADRSELVPAPSSYSLARMVHPVSTEDVEVRFTMRFTDASTQGVGFYVRQNSGYLHDTTPAGEGYAVFVEAFRGPGIGVWREVGGSEQDIQIHFDAALGLVNGVDYRVRFRAYQLDPTTTMLQAKVWPAADVEPFGWQVEATDSTPSLQNIAGGIAIDSWSSIQAPNPIDDANPTIVDDIEIVPLCDPLAGLPALTSVSEGYSFTEGPLWRGDHLLFTDLDLAVIERLDPPADLSTHRAMSNEANGIALTPDGHLLAAERNPPRISIDTGAGPVTWIDEVGGDGFNAPNDLAVRSDGVVYFTDPTYGMIGSSDLGYNGLFRVTPGVSPSVVDEWQGVQGTNQPNGVALSPDERLLFVTDSQQGNLLVWSVNPDGSLDYIELVDNGLNVPDGMCVGPYGNLWVATWNSTLEVYSMDGTHWGSLAVPQQATNCAFGGNDGRTLYVTAQTGLYAATFP